MIESRDEGYSRGSASGVKPTNVGCDVSSSGPRDWSSVGAAEGATVGGGDWSTDSWEVEAEEGEGVTV